MIKNCKQCGKTFELTDTEIAFYKSKHLDLPKRCKECRELNKSQNKPTTYNKPAQSNQQTRKPLNKWGILSLVLIVLIAVLVTSKCDVYDIGSNNTQTTVTYLDQSYKFKNNEYLQEHYEKHGKEMGYKSAREYQEGADRVVHTKGVLHKVEKEDGDDVFYLEDTNEFVIISKAGYIRTYFEPNDGIEYFNRQ